MRSVSYTHLAERIERRGAREHHGVGAVNHLHGSFDALGKMMGFARVIANDLARDFRVGVAAEFDAFANKVDVYKRQAK